MKQFIEVLLVVALLFGPHAAVAADERVADGLVVYFPLTMGGGTAVLDRAGTGEPMDLQIAGDVDWLPVQNGLIVDDGRIGTLGAATKLFDRLQATSQSTFEVWIVPSADTGGPARLLSIDGGTAQPSFALDQFGADVEVRLLHSGKDPLGQPGLLTADGPLGTQLVHLVHTFDGTTERLYVDGVEHPTTVNSVGDFSLWDPTERFSIASTSDSSLSWSGTLRSVAVYDRALTPAEVWQNFTASPDAASMPRVDAGADQATPTTPAAPTHDVTLAGSVVDDGLPDPPGVLAISWSLVSGPGAVIFDDPTALQTGANFSADGVYVLRLSADDGSWVGSDTVTIRVNETSTEPAPQNFLPLDSATNVSTTPTLELVCPAGNAVEAHFVIAADAGFASIAYDSGASPNDVCGHVAFAGLTGDTEYHWSARVRDAAGVWSPWSVPGSFSTIDAAVLSEISLRHGVDGYAGASDTDMRGSGVDPLTAVREWNQGAYREMRTGRRPEGYSTDEIFRSLIRFDVSDLTDPESVVGVRLELTGWSAGGEQFFFHGPQSFYSLFRPWGEGSGLSSQAPKPGEASWTFSEFPVSWSLPGAAGVGSDRSGTPVLEGRMTAQNGYKTFWSSQALVDLVKQWIADPEANFGILIRADDETVRNRMYIGTKEHPDPSFRPRLIIETTEYPECLHALDADSCNDGNACTSDGSCFTGACLAGPALPDGTGTLCGVGACAAAGSCTGGVDSCTPGTPAADDSVCDGIDEDCDGGVDEDYLPPQTNCGVGACSANGAWLCVDGGVENSCVPGLPAPDDASCDGIDDDCDGLVDEEYPSEPTSCGLGACASVGASSCVAGSIESDCSPGVPAADDASCDGIDDDCDGLADEDFLSLPTSCGVGACAAAGTTTCLAGGVADTCSPGVPAADDASCDTIDDDCDGLADEDYFPLPTSCGVGACGSTGATSCVAGAVEDTCSPGSPALDDATCDGIDDDCDGLIDEDYLPLPTACGVGACGSEGVTSCVAGAVEDSCSAGSPGLDDATCDGIDDDCDGLADEDYLSLPTSCGVGACGSEGATSCVAGAVEDSCSAGAPGLDDATCDGIDDDCDGLADEDYLSLPTSCGVGACGSEGATSCEAGAVADSCSAGSPGLDDATCDGIDDDCDGLADEDYLSLPTSCGVGACGSEGATSCEAGAVADSCSAGSPGLDDATCDGIDDDCDGLIDEDYLPLPTTCGVGACGSEGVTSCVAGAVADSCSAGSPAFDDATCDGIDDDCDGLADEDYLSLPTSCGLGACGSEGATSCVAGAVADSCSAGSPALDDATCDGIDNDCDGLADEDYLSLPTGCGVGACGSAGATSCVAGAVADSCSAGSPALDDAICDGIDDDCDGLADEDYLSLPTSCGLGACGSEGATSCVAGAVADSCSADSPALDDATCDGIDDDCDGLADEDYLSLPTSCGVGACGSAGATSCVAGAVADSCSAGPPALDDATCDGIDDDCDGLADEDYLSLPTSCGVGACGSEGATSCEAGAVADSCSAGSPGLDDATCDGIDDDCDGLIDEDYLPLPTTCGVGACDSEGVTSCVAGAVADSCSAGSPAFDDATCDGIDDDCDGLADEDYLSLPTSCGVGACGSEGATSCVAGAVADSCSAGAPALDDATCDGIDDDCDGLADEDYQSEPTSCGAGICVSAGATSCVAGTTQDSCSPGAAEVEMCDGVDNDCDGAVDEGDSLDALTWYRDSDGDTRGDPISPTSACLAPTGFVVSATDCDDGSVNTYPGAAEFNDGRDNQCPGDPGYGLVDEILDGASFHDAIDKASYSWPAQPGVISYEVKRSTSRDFSAECTSFSSGNTVVFDPETPGAGSAFYYLVRPLQPNAGSWGMSSIAERSDICP